jgi:adenylate cyclase
MRHVSSLSDQKFVELLEHVTSEFDQYLRNTEIASRDAIEALGDQVLDAATARIRDMLNADRATIYIYDREKETLRSKIAHSNTADSLDIQISVHKGIASRVALTGETLNVENAYAHPDFNPEVDKGTGYQTQTILCMPIHDRRKQVFAVAQLLNKKTGQPFTKQDEQRFRDFAGPLGILLESCSRLGKAAV